MVHYICHILYQRCEDTAILCMGLPICTDFVGKILYENNKCTVLQLIEMIINISTEIIIMLGSNNLFCTKIIGCAKS